MTETTASTRQPTAVDAVADAHFDAVVASSPMEATYLGVPGGETEIDDLSPDGYAHHASSPATRWPPSTRSSPSTRSTGSPSPRCASGSG